MNNNISSSIVKQNLTARRCRHTHTTIQKAQVNETYNTRYLCPPLYPPSETSITHGVREPCNHILNVFRESCNPGLTSGFMLMYHCSDGEVSHAATMFALSILSLGTRGKVDNGFPETYEGTPLGDALARSMGLLELVSRTKSEH